MADTALNAGACRHTAEESRRWHATIRLVHPDESGLETKKATNSPKACSLLHSPSFETMPFPRLTLVRLPGPFSGKAAPD